MKVCLRAARRGRARVHPNPLVGAAVVKRGRVVAVGHHARFGGEHAEVVALRRAGKQASGATLYVTLEPCAHHGKTPPCVDAILRAGVARVVAAMRDPHPLVDGRGFRALRRAGVRVDVGTLRAPAEELNAAYTTVVLEGRPFVTLKVGMTLDGKIATARGESRYITSPASRRAAHRMRGQHDAVLVGAGTARADDPRLTARGVRGPGRQPARVVLDTRLTLSPRSRLLTTRGGRVLVYTASASSRGRARLERAGATVMRVGRGRSGGVDLGSVLSDLTARGVGSLLVEGGGDVAWSFLHAGAVDRVVLFVAPKILGGRDAVPAVAGRGAARLADAIHLNEMRIRRLAGDIVITGRPGAVR
ncbi:MAG: bifunctional diaminohydroxyphosphoribosylaminopyrimidine deaminase/5-amino-6-(5-phosphoribosylamino)uracil reductase RibD [Acidobacteria bacterium]|nr:bifunctional diaminohydroxyphosphoribosylaminopyrimidine deaminase/5-amino-6-(5-phosphoribosylamino)uracil reductase RibD [Acidobacteriota bacterium]